MMKEVPLIDRIVQISPYLPDRKYFMIEPGEY